MNENFVIVKLVSGEQVMATLTNEDANTIQLHYPMVIKMIPFIQDDQAHEHVTAAPLCQFSDDNNYIIEKTNVLFVKKLHEVLIPHYNRIVDEHENTVLVRSDKTGHIQRMKEELTVEDIQKRINMLERMTGLERDTEEEEEEKSYYIEGNDTVH
jgi:small nuclear ribonucleoprotein (snRNP)-like protein